MDLQHYKQQLLQATETGNVQQSVRKFLAFTAARIKEQNFIAASKCFAVADRLHSKGNALVKHTIEQVFISSFPTLLFAAGDKKSQLFSIIPSSLYNIYEDCKAEKKLV